MDVILCNLKELPKKDGGGDIYIADLLAIDGNSTVLFSRFIDKSKYDELSYILKRTIDTQERIIIPDLYLLIKARNNNLFVDIDFDKFITDYSNYDI